MNNLFNQKPGEEKAEQKDNLESDEALEKVNDHYMVDQGSLLLIKRGGCLPFKYSNFQQIYKKTQPIL